MKYKELVHWPRKCPRCGTIFQSVIELGRCPECELRFKADSAGVAYNIEKEHPTLGIIESFRAQESEELGAREWGIKRFERIVDPERCVSVVGDCSGPQARSFDDILKIAECCDEIERLVVGEINGDPKAYPFASRITEIYYFKIRFFDRDDSTHYSAHLQYSLPNWTLFISDLPFTKHLGCNEYELVFEMRGFEFVGLYPGTVEGTANSILKRFFGCLVPLVLFGAAMVLGIIKLVGLLV